NCGIPFEKFQHVSVKYLPSKPKLVFFLFELKGFLSVSSCRNICAIAR
ncbi:hypothetical protein A2U01_0069060, partial [Trifolium medium]|nr:hypothetical protein [Trifolium medium]